MYTKKRSSTSMNMALRRFFDRQDTHDDLCLAKLWEAWDTIFEPEIATLIRPLGHKKDILLLGADDAIVMQEFTYFSDQILEKANAFLGKQFFGRIRIELLKGRSPLNARLLPPPPGRRPPVRPEGLGTMPHDMQASSPVTRAYFKYVSLFTADVPDSSPATKGSK
jgi:hypothetical protein